VVTWTRWGVVVGGLVGGTGAVCEVDDPDDPAVGAEVVGVVVVPVVWLAGVVAWPGSDRLT
jgi:hypothetical protein